MLARSCCNYRTSTLNLAHLVGVARTHTQEGDTALSLALIQSTTSGCLDAVRLLLDSKADIRAASKVDPRFAV
jgi:ankyrin repeat protein